MSNVCKEKYNCQGLCCLKTDLLVTQQERDRFFPLIAIIKIIAGKLQIHVEPCPHTENGECLIYEDRPESCQDYPSGGFDCKASHWLDS